MQNYKLNPENKPTEMTDLKKWYDRLQAEYGDKAFSYDDALVFFEKYTCGYFAKARLNAMLASGILVEAKE